ncbi:MAG: glutathione S-transferase family protein [Myxococcota bacterium]
MGSDAPLRVYGAVPSYYTGKLEGYLRYKEIPYTYVPLKASLRRKLRREVGNDQVPAVELPDGRFMTDTTPMIAWFEEQHPDPPVIPRDPLQSFVSRLVEDYAEEWLWRPAMHYRWSYRTDRMHLSRRLADELMSEIPLPAFVKRAMVRRRQWGSYVKADAVTRETWDHVEGIYFGALEQLEAIFATRPYLLGDVPSLADFGFFASMFRHFAQDPTPSDLMRQRAPGVFEWQARLWNARGSRTQGSLLSGIPDDWSPILREIGDAYLPFLNANARAWAARTPRFDVEIQGVPYRSVPMSQYRVWCLEELRRHHAGLPDDAGEEARKLLEAHGCWEPLFAETVESGYDPEGRVPFRGRKVHFDNAADPASRG